MNEHLSFRLPSTFVAEYERREVRWGFPCGGGLTLGELNFVDKYSRLKADGTKERWHEACARVVEGTYSILKDHCARRRTPWDDAKAQRSAQEAYERMFTFRWLPPGRGIWMMGTEFVAEHGSAALENCAFVSTGQPRGLVNAAHRLMEMSMLGVGVGFDSLAADDGAHVYDPTGAPNHVLIPDSREGWCDSTAILLRAYLEPGQPTPIFDYSRIRPAGQPIRGFGGVAAGPEPLMELHENLRRLLDGYVNDGRAVDSMLVGDVMTMVARCVVAGNVRRSALIWLGHDDDKAFLQAKDWTVNPERMAPNTGWGFASNNSIVASVGSDYTELARQNAVNGEPGLVYLDLCRDYGRLADPPNGRDYRVAGINPCGEQPLEDGELCTLVNVYPTNCDDKDDYQRTLKFGYLYAKAVTLLSTHWEDANEVMRRNHRIGTSMAGQAEFVETNGWAMLKEWQDDGYATIKNWDRIYSEWLGVRESIKVTTSKPDGTTALLAGVTPGAAWPTETGGYIRRIRLAADSPLVDALQTAGVPIEPDVTDARRAVAEFPTTGPDIRGEREVSVWEKAELAAMTQRHWSDNAVSVTLSFLPTEADDVGRIIHAFDGRLKTMSFLPMPSDEQLAELETVYPQMPYEAINEDELDRRRAAIGPIDTAPMYGVGAEDAAGERFCTTEHCELPAT